MNNHFANVSIPTLSVCSFKTIRPDKNDVERKEKTCLALDQSSNTSDSELIDEDAFSPGAKKAQSHLTLQHYTMTGRFLRGVINMSKVGRSVSSSTVLQNSKGFDQWSTVFA